MHDAANRFGLGFGLDLRFGDGRSSFALSTLRLRPSLKKFVYGISHFSTPMISRGYEHPADSIVL